MKGDKQNDVHHFYRYATFADTENLDKNPMQALQRDALLVSMDGEGGDRNLRPIYTSQLEQLECLIRTQKEFQTLLKSNYTSLLEKYKHVVNELQKLRRHINATLVNKLLRERIILERKLNEQINVRMTLENLFRTMIRALHRKSAALEELKKQMKAIEKERDNLRSEVNQLERNNHLMEKRSREIPNCSQHNICDAKSRNDANMMHNNGSFPRFAAHQRSFEVLTAKRSGHKSSSFTRSLSKIDSDGPIGVTSLRPSIPLNLLRSNVELKPKGHSGIKFPSCSPTVRINLVACSLSTLVNKHLSSDVNINYFRLGCTNVRPQMTWNQFDIDVRNLLYGYMQTIVQTTELNCFTSVLRSARKTIANSSQSPSSLRNAGANLEAFGLDSKIHFQLGSLNWLMGSSPIPNSVTVRQLKLSQGATPKDGYSSPYELFAAFPSTLTIRNEVQQIDKSHHRTSDENTSTERDTAMIQHQLVLGLDPIAQVSINCGVSPVCVKNYLHTMELHHGLILMTDTGLQWTARLINSLAELFMSHFGTDERIFTRYTLTRESLRTGTNSFNLRSWLYKQNLIHYGSVQPEEDPKSINENVLLVFETMDFLKLKSNQKFFSYLVGISGEMDEKLAWAPRFKRAFVLGLSNSSSIDWLRVFIPFRTDFDWLVQANPKQVDANQSQSLANSILVHELNLNCTPLIDAVPMQLRLAAHKIGITSDDASSTNKCASVTEKIGKFEVSEDTHPNAGAFFRWIEGVWTRLYMYVKWLGIHRTERLRLEPDESSHMPLEFQLNSLSSANVTMDDTRMDQSEWMEFTRVFVKAQLDAKTQRLLSELLDPDHFLTFPGLHAVLNEDRTIDLNAILKWIEVQWNTTFEPGLQACVLAVRSLDSDSENQGPMKPFVCMKFLDPLQVRQRRQQGCNLPGSDVAATLFLRQIVMPECPLQGNARLLFATRLTGGDAFQPRLGPNRRFPFDASDTIPLLTENKTFKSIARVYDEPHMHKRVTSDRCRMRLKVGDGQRLNEQSDTVGNHNATVALTERRKKPGEAPRHVKLPESVDTGEQRGNVTCVRFGSCGSGINALVSYQHIYDEPYRPVRFRTYSPQRSRSEGVTIQTSQSNERGLLTHRAAANSDHKAVSRTNTDFSICEDYLHDWNPVSIV